MDCPLSQAPDNHSRRLCSEVLRIPAQSCHPFQTNAATHSILKLPLIPVNVATLMVVMF
jgi:hypothetical protein